MISNGHSLKGEMNTHWMQSQYLSLVPRLSVWCMHNLTCVYYTKGLGTRLTQNSNKWMGELSKAAKIGRLNFERV